jgi:menaquinol-cytochrome c reductase iron-sulfur subunit
LGDNLWRSFTEGPETHLAARRKQRTPKYTSDLHVPGAFPGETLTRRRFMTGTAHTAGGVAVGAIALPSLGFALGPLFDKPVVRWETVGFPNDFPADNYVPKIITVTPDIGDVGKTTVYLRARNPQFDTTPVNQYNRFIAISSRCAHLGCPVRWTPAAERFICPCHGGVYDLQGARTGGPPVRPLDRFATRLMNGMVQVGPRYSVNSELKAFSPRDPGEPIDGLGQYAFPSRPTTRKLPGL